MMDLTSLQSIEEQLIEEPVRSVIQKTEYMHNLKSQCYFKQNALKTAENLIEEYHRQNQELKIQVVRLNLKIQNYEERMEIFRQQVEMKDNSYAKTYQKQLFKSSHKLSKVLQKYSELQQKFHSLQKELAKYKFYKMQNEERILKENNKKQKALKIQIERQFDNFLRTPAHKSTMFNTNPSTSKKQSASKNNNFKNLKLGDFESEPNDQDKTKYYYESSSDETKGHIKIGDQLFDRRLSIKKSAEKVNKMHQRGIRQNQKHQQAEKDGILYKKLKILEWKLKQKDEEIMLMLRRNKEIQTKYSLLKQIIQDQKQQSSASEDNSGVNSKRKGLSKETPNNSSHTNPTLKGNRHYETSHKDQNDDKKTQQMKSNDRKITHFNASLNESTNNTTWKNYKTYKFN